MAFFTLEFVRKGTRVAESVDCLFSVNLDCSSLDSWLSFADRVHSKIRTVFESACLTDENGFKIFLVFIVNGEVLLKIFCSLRCLTKALLYA